MNLAFLTELMNKNMLKELQHFIFIWNSLLKWNTVLQINQVYYPTCKQDFTETGISDIWKDDGFPHSI